MNFVKHSELKDKHAILSPSSHSWTNYDDDRLHEFYTNFQARVRGTRLHNLAQELISLGIRLPATKKTLNMYVNDAIGYRMTPEQILYYSENCFGTTDAICFRRNLLRVHDYKSGKARASMRQLEVYAALFCLEYGHKPGVINIELRIYQHNEVYIYIPEPEDISMIMDKIIRYDKHITTYNLEG